MSGVLIRGYLANFPGVNAHFSLLNGAVLAVRVPGIQAQSHLCQKVVAIKRGRAVNAVIREAGNYLSPTSSVPALAKRRATRMIFLSSALSICRAVHRIVEQLRPPAGTPLYEGGNLEEVLRRLARLMLRAALMPMALSLNRLMVAEAQRFPELIAIVAREAGRAEVVGQIAAMLDREARAGALAIDRPPRPRLADDRG